MPTCPKMFVRVPKMNPYRAGLAWASLLATGAAPFLLMVKPLRSSAAVLAFVWGDLGVFATKQTREQRTRFPIGPTKYLEFFPYHHDSNRASASRVGRPQLFVGLGRLSLWCWDEFVFGAIVWGSVRREVYLLRRYSKNPAFKVLSSVIRELR